MRRDVVVNLEQEEVGVVFCDAVITETFSVFKFVKHGTAQDDQKIPDAKAREDKRAETYVIVR
jgi:hypothetical protein